MSEKFHQLCAWVGTTLNGKTAEDFEKFFKELGYRVKFAEEVKRVGTDQSIILFWIHDDDVERFAIPRLKMGISWWEDLIKYNGHRDWFTKETLDKYPCIWW